MVESTGRLIFAIHLSRLQPGNQIVRFNINQLHLICRIKHRIGNPFTDSNLCNRCHQVVEGFQMLDIDRCININTCPKKLFHILIALRMTASRRIAVRQFIHKHYLGMAFERRIQIKFFEFNSFIINFFVWKLL